jgi:hypothetical protein
VSAKSLADSKPKLLGLISAIVIGILAVPVILPHVSHVGMIYHIILHLASLIISIFLSVISLIAYKRQPSDRLLYMALGFMLLILIECIDLIFATTNIEDIIIPVVRIELPHIILFAMLTLFGMGVFRLNQESMS